jgi:hypothetical protein
MFKCTHDYGLITTIKYPHGNHYYTWIEGSRAIHFNIDDEEFIVTKWGITKVKALKITKSKEEDRDSSEEESDTPKPIPEIKTLEVRKGNDGEVDILEKRNTIK